MNKKVHFVTAPFLSIKFVVDEQPLRPPSAASSPIRGAAGRPCELRPAGRPLGVPYMTSLH